MSQSTLTRSGCAVTTAAVFRPDLAAVLFDLDGTLVDSAPDLVHAMTLLCEQIGSPPPDGSAVRSAVSKGGREMLRRGVAAISDLQVEELLPAFLDLYAATLGERSRCYAGIESLLELIEQRGLRWGIVTNKPGWLARPLVEQLGLALRCSALVSGDCLATRKPDPEPLLHACALANLDPGRCIYVGDDRRDIQAGRAAGMATVAAAWGYIDGEDLVDWNADAILATPQALCAALAAATG